MNIYLVLLFLFVKCTKQSDEILLFIFLMKKLRLQDVM